MAEEKIVSGQNVVLTKYDGDVIVRHGATVTSETDLITVTGKIICQGDATFLVGVVAQSFHVDDEDAVVTIYGDLGVEKLVDIQGTLSVKGSMNGDTIVGQRLYVQDDLTADKIDLDSELIVEGTIIARDIDVGGKLRAGKIKKCDSVDVGGSAELFKPSEVKHVDVGGKLSLHGGVFEDIEVGGKFKSEGEIHFTSVDVGGKCKLEGIVHGGKIDVGGILSGEGEIEVEKIDVGGKCKLEGNIRGQVLVVGGTAKLSNNVHIETIKVGGKIKVSGNLEAEKIDVGGLFKCDAQLKVTEKLSVGGKAEFSQEIIAKTVNIGGTIKLLRMNAEIVKVGGEIEAKDAVIAHEIVLGKKSKARGLLVADLIQVREGSEVEALHGATIKLEKKVKVKGEILYTEELLADPTVNFKYTPKKVETLPRLPKSGNSFFDKENANS